MYIFKFTKSAFKEVNKLPPDIRQRILEKLKFYHLQENPLQFAQIIKDKRFGDFRFRIGGWRVLFDVDDKKIIILKVGHRRDIYR